MCAAANANKWAELLNVCRTEFASVPKTIRNKTNQERIQPTQKSKINSSTPYL